MKFKIDDNLKRVAAAMAEAPEATSYNLMQHLSGCGLLDEEDEANYGRTVSDILADIDLFRITEALAQYQLATGNFGEGTALSITSDVFDAFCALVALGDGNCPECGAWLKCEPQYMTKGRTHDYPGDDIIYEYVYDCPVCDFHAVTSKDIYNSI